MNSDDFAWNKFLKKMRNLNVLFHPSICRTANWNVSTVQKSVFFSVRHTSTNSTSFENLYRLSVPLSVLFCFLLMAEEKVKEEERKCNQRPASISPSVRGEDWSLPWLISRLIWQDMFDLIKASGRKPVPDVKNKKQALSPLTRNSIT